MSDRPLELQRQHPMAWVFQALTVLKSAVLPAVFFLVFSQGLVLGWLALLVVIPAIAVGVAQYLALTYGFDEDALVVRDGILRRNERRIRYSRIQNVDEVQGIVHRLLRVVAVKIETGSGGAPEAVLNLGPDAAKALREGIFLRRSDAGAEPAGAESEPALIEVPLTDLVRLGLIQNRGILVIAALLGLLSQAFSGGDDDLWEIAGRWALENAAGSVSAIDLTAVGWVIAGAFLVVGAYLLLTGLSVALAVLRFFGFRLERRGSDLVTRYGLLTKVQVTIPLRRIQRLRVEESLFHRIFRRLTVRLDTAGGASAGDGGGSGLPLTSGQESGTQWLAPVAPPAMLRPLFVDVMPTANDQPLGTLPSAAAPPESPGVWRPVAHRAVHRLFRRWSLLLLVATFGLAWLSLWALLLPLALPLVWWLSRRTIAARHYCATTDGLWWRRGWPGRSLVVIPFDKIQSVRLRRSPFDRRHHMAKLIVDTAGSGSFHAASIAYLDQDDATKLAELLATAAARSEFVWS